jgi:hypothetical protein
LDPPIVVASSCWRRPPRPGEEPPYDYLVTLEVADKAHLGENVAGERMLGLLSELYGYADVTQLMAERFV